MTYNEFIQNIIDTRGQWNIPDGEYYEKHHIIPKCIKENNNIINIIYLYPEEHYEAHRLLAIENRDNIGLQFSWYMISKRNGVDISSEEYKVLRENYNRVNKEFHTGKRYSDEINKKKGLPGKLNPMYGKRSWNHDMKTSDETKNKISISNSGESNGMYNKYGNLHPRSKEVIDLNTNVIYGSLREASRILNIKLTGLYKKVINRDGFMYYDDYIRGGGDVNE